MTDTLSIDVTGIHVGNDVNFMGGYSACLTSSRVLELIDTNIFIAPTREEAISNLKEHYTEGIRAGDPSLTLDDAFHIFLMQNKLKV